MKEILPDLLTFNDGSPVTATGWEKRRGELFDAIVPHQYGGLPPKGESTTAVKLCTHNNPYKKTIYHSYEVRVSFAGGRELTFMLNLWIPGTGDGPFPVVIDGDGCWRYFDDEMVERVLARGNIAASFNRAQFAADNPDLYRETGLYRLFPQAEFGAIAAWAWGYHRCVDVLAGLDFVRPDQIAITGHSRGGKTVLLAGATDDRIAVTNPNNSGAAGSGLNRLKCEGAELIADYHRSRNIFWFGQAYIDSIGRDGELPYDQHFFHALVAPRGLLLNEAYEDRWANPPGSYAACLAAREVYELLGKKEQIGWAFREGWHGHLPADYDALLDLLDGVFHGREVDRDFQRPLYPHLNEILKPVENFY